MEKLKTICNQVSDRIDRFDLAIILILVIGYGIFSFWNLGSTKSPQTYHAFKENQNEIILKLKEESYVTHVRYFAFETPGSYRISTSSDGKNYHELKIEKEQYVFAWHDLDINERTQYIKIEGMTSGSQIGELKVYQSVNELPIEVDPKIKHVTDEPDTVPTNISYQNSTYFDEIYFARTAYEYANGLPAYEWVHPPLGKLIQSIPIRLFGMNPFTYRMMGNISGILLIVVMYMFAKNMFRHRSYALLAAGIMMFDNFHFAQSRMGTIDTHLVLFILTSYWMMYRYIKMDGPIKKRYRALLGSGIAIGCAIATKWTGLFAGLGLAIIFFVHFFQTYYKKKERLQEAKQIILFCIAVFIMIPIVIYCSCYFLFPKVSSYNVSSFSELFHITNEVFNYHNLLTETHPFSSMWYTWPALLRPVWYYASDVGGWYQTISGMGNPLIWWTGIIAFITCLIHWIMSKKKEIPVCMIAICCMFFSYIPITRDMFLYHYFPVLPFVMLLVVWWIKKLQEWTKNRAILPLFSLLVIVLFCYFYPVTSGMNIEKETALERRWFSSWYF